MPTRPAHSCAWWICSRRATTSRTSTSTSTSRTRCSPTPERLLGGRDDSAGLPGSRGMLDRVVVAVLADREDAQVALAVVDELVGQLRALALGEEVARADAEALVAGIQPAGAGEHEEALLLAAVPVEPGRALPGVDDIEVDADAAEAGAAADQRRQTEALAARLGLVLADRQLVDADEPGRAAVLALDELLGAHAVGLADAPIAGGEHAALDPAAWGEIVGDVGAGVDPAPLAIDRQERVHVSEDADQLADGADRIGEAARVAGDRGDGPDGALGHSRRC